jgi:hypothetical protein
VDIEAPWTSACSGSNAEKMHIKKLKMRKLVEAEILLLEQQRLLEANCNYYV